MSDTHEWITDNATRLIHETPHGLGYWLDELSFIADLPERDDIVALSVSSDTRPSFIVRGGGDGA